MGKLVSSRVKYGMSGRFENLNGYGMAVGVYKNTYGHLAFDSLKLRRKRVI